MVEGFLARDFLRFFRFLEEMPRILTSQLLLLWKASNAAVRREHRWKREMLLGPHISLTMHCTGGIPNSGATAFVGGVECCRQEGRGTGLKLNVYYSVALNTEVWLSNIMMNSSWAVLNTCLLYMSTDA